MEPTVFIIVGAVVLLFIIIALFGKGLTPEDIGNIGEARTARYLRKLPADDYTILHDLMVADSNGRTTQIDHIVVSRYGLFVIETKCFKGWIFGDEKSRVWTQSLSLGRGWFAGTEKHTFQNPIRQNWRHIYGLAEQLKLPKRLFRNVVVFAGDAEIKTEVPDYVMSAYNVAEYVRSFEAVLLSDAQVARIVSKLQRYAQLKEEEQRFQHVQMLQETHAPVSEGDQAPRCPRCGSPMRKRHRRSDNAPFYGCSRYPSCKGVVNIES